MGATPSRIPVSDASDHFPFADMIEEWSGDLANVEFLEDDYCNNGENDFQAQADPDDDETGFLSPNQGESSYGYTNIEYLDTNSESDEMRSEATEEHTVVEDYRSIVSERLNVSHGRNADFEIKPVDLPASKSYGLTSVMSQEELPEDAMTEMHAVGYNWEAVAECSNTHTDAEVISLKALLEVERNKRSQAEIELRLLKEKLRRTERTNNRRAVNLKKKGNDLSGLNDQLKRIRKQKDTVDSVVAKNLKMNPVVYDSLKNCSKKPKARRYSPQLKKFALSTYLSGPRTYRLIKKSKVLCLPSKRTIKRWTKAVQLCPALNPAISRCMRSKTSKFEGKDRVVVLAIDGMKLKPCLSYNAKSDVFHGLPDDGTRMKIEKNNVNKLATEAVTVMIRGIYKNFKQRLGYFLTHNTLGSEQQQKIVEKTVRSIREVGLHPLILTLDQFATNIKMTKDAGVTPEKPYFHVDGQRVYVMWDSPHLMKNTRNMLKKHNAVFDGKIACFADIAELQEIDSSDGGLRIVPRLTDKHILVPPFSPMNVSLAARTLSQSVSFGIRVYVEMGLLQHRALETADFVEMHDKLFDTFNSKFENCPGKPFRGALKGDSCHWQFLEEAKKTLSKMYYTDKSCLDTSKAASASQVLTSAQRHPNYVRGYISNINATEMIWEELENQHDIDYLCTNPIGQDCLENLFSELRRRCGGNDAPNAYQFGSAFKYAAIEATINQLAGTNCLSDESIPLITDEDLDDLDLLTNDQELSEVCYKYKVASIDTSKKLEIRIIELNALVYILGAAVKKIPHSKCIAKLTIEKDGSLLNDEMYTFCKIKQSVSGRHHTMPNSRLYAIGMLCFAAFKQRFERFLYQNRRGVKSRLKAMVDYNMFDDSLCLRCFNVLIDKIFNILIQGFLKQTRTKEGRKKAVHKRFKRNPKAKRMSLPLTKRST